MNVINGILAIKELVQRNKNISANRSKFESSSEAETDIAAVLALKFNEEKHSIEEKGRRIWVVIGNCFNYG